MLKGYPIADWQDWNLYDRFLRAPIDRLRWEFLRRNPVYQADFAAHAKPGGKCAVFPGSIENTG